MPTWFNGNVIYFLIIFQKETLPRDYADDI